MSNQGKNISKWNDKVVNYISKNIITVFLLFLVLVFLIPRVLIKSSFLGFIPNETNLSDFSNVLNGLTSPLIALFSAFLIYIAFKEQVKANTELQKFNIEQIQYLKSQEIKNEWTYLNNILENIKIHFDNLELEIVFNKGLINEEKIIYKGSKAAMILLTIYKNNNSTNVSSLSLRDLNYNLRNVYRQIQFMLTKVHNSKVDKLDKDYFFICVKNYLIVDKSESKFYQLEKFINQNKTTTFVAEIDEYKKEYDKLIKVINDTNIVFRNYTMI